LGSRKSARAREERRTSHQTPDDRPGVHLRARGASGHLGTGPTPS